MWRLAKLNKIISCFNLVVTLICIVLARVSTHGIHARAYVWLWVWKGEGVAGERGGGGRGRWGGRGHFNKESINNRNQKYHRKRNIQSKISEDLF